MNKILIVGLNEYTLIKIDKLFFTGCDNGFRVIVDRH